MKPRALTGIKPTGLPHVGNYVGAMLPILNFAKDTTYDTNIFIADYHALNLPEERVNIKERTYAVTAIYLALGLDPKGCLLYRQSDVPETFELTMMLSNFTAKGHMNRAHSYKALVQANREAGLSEDELDSGINMGLFNYPVLMTADILLFDTDVVPVGRDQRQHLEFARDIAGSFNAVYGPVFKPPQTLFREEMDELPGLDGRKMSKSYHNYLPIFAPEDEVQKLCMKIKTDSLGLNDPKDPETSLIWKIYKGLASKEDSEAFGKRFLGGGMGYGEAKKELAALHTKLFGKAHAEYERLMADKAYLDTVLANGAARARAIAIPVMNRAREAVGFVKSDNACLFSR